MKNIFLNEKFLKLKLNFHKKFDIFRIFLKNGKNYEINASNNANDASYKWFRRH